MVAIAEAVRVVGPSLQYERAIRSALRRYPQWVLVCASVSRVEVVATAELREESAAYFSSDRAVRIYPGLADPSLTLSLGRALFCAADDTGEQPPAFSTDAAWLLLHKDQANFSMPKYAEQPLAYFADVATKYHLLGREKLRITHPEEVVYLEDRVFPRLKAMEDR